MRPNFSRSSVIAEAISFSGLTMPVSKHAWNKLSLEYPKKKVHKKAQKERLEAAPDWGGFFLVRKTRNLANVRIAILIAS